MSEQENTPETKEPTLEELASSFREPQTQPARKDPAIQVPKFEKSEDFQEWASTQLAEVTSALNHTRGELNERNAKEFLRAQDEAISDAVNQIKSEVDGLDDVFAEGALHVKYSRDPNFKKIFDNRDQNPAAYRRALGLVAKELKAKAQWEPDPQGAENARAIRELQKNSGKKASVEDKDERFRKMNPSDFEREWERLKQG